MSVFRMALSAAAAGLLALSAPGGTATAAGFKDDPYESFWVKGLLTTKTTISWETAKNPNQRCQEESKRRGKGGFGQKVEACSFWDKNTCHIITGPYTNMHQLGHETRHCFMGNFH